MHAYRFRLLFDDQEDFLRDFDILASQTFLDFHSIIRQSVELPGNELASFFVCDKNWRKKREITLTNMNADNSAHSDKDDDDDSRRGKRERMVITEMASTRIKDVIDDPHQRLLYEYDFLNTRTFFIELMRIVESENRELYPLCSKSLGKLTFTAPLPIKGFDSPVADEDEITLLSEFDDIMSNDNEDEDDIPIDPTLEQSTEW